MHRRFSRVPSALVIVVAFAVLAGCSPPAPKWMSVVRLDAPTPKRPSNDGPESGVEDAGSRDRRLVDIGHEARIANPARPGKPVNRTLVIPPAALLRFGYAIETGVQHDITFRILADRENKPADTVFETVQKADHPKGRWTSWTDAEVDLSGYSGEKITLTFETDTDGPFDPSEGQPFWSAPEILAPSTTDNRPLNVVLISIDTLRSDHLSLYGYDRLTSPEIDSWALEHGVVFENTVAQSPWTLPSHTSMLTGINAFRHGTNHNSAAPNSLTTLAEILRGAGYATLAVTGGAYLHPMYGLAQGVDRTFYWPEAGDTAGEIDAGTDKALALIEQYESRPFFLFFHTYEVHHRTQPRPETFSQFSDLDPTTKIQLIRAERTPNEGFVRSIFPALSDPKNPGEYIPIPPELQNVQADIYDSHIAYMDAKVGRILHQLDSFDLSRRSIVVLTSDHGELLGEHGLGGHLYLYDENLLVPLVIAAPELQMGGARIGTQVRLIDIVPTVLDLVGLPTQEGIDGRSLLPLLKGNSVQRHRNAWTYAATSNRGVSLRIDNRLKYVLNDAVWAPVNGTDRAYDLEADPEEMNPIGNSDERIPDLRQMVTARVSEELAGLRLRFVNQGLRPLHGTLRGQPITLSRIKSLDLGCPCVSWRGKAEVTFSVPPATSYTLILQDIQSGSLEISTAETPGGPPAHTQRIDLASFRKPMTVHFDGSRWIQTEGVEGPLSTGYKLWYGTEMTSADVVPEDIDPELRAQLEALGYL